MSDIRNPSTETSTALFIENVSHVMTYLRRVRTYLWSTTHRNPELFKPGAQQQQAIRESLQRIKESLYHASPNTVFDDGPQPTTALLGLAGISFLTYGESVYDIPEDGSPKQEMYNHMLKVRGDLLDMLLARGVDRNYKVPVNDSDVEDIPPYQIPLFRAIYRKNVGMAVWLIDHGADVITSFKDMSPLSLTLDCPEEKVALDILQRMLQKGLNPKSTLEIKGKTIPIIDYASSTSKPAVSQLLLTSSREREQAETLRQKWWRVLIVIIKYIIIGGIVGGIVYAVVRSRRRRSKRV